MRGFGVVVAVGFPPCATTLGPPTDHGAPTSIAIKRSGTASKGTVIRGSVSSGARNP